MQEVITIGGGEYIVNVLNAVAAWCGGGGFRSLLRVVMVIGLIYALLVVAFSMNWKLWLNWFLGATLMYGALIVPTTTVQVTDRLNPSLAPATVANVPIGLAAVAAVSSQAGDWLTRTAETVFVMPSALRLSSNGMIYGARLYDKTTDFEIRDPRVRSNTEEYFRQCLFYDIMLGHKSFHDLAVSSDLLSDMGPGSQARGMKWLDASGNSTVVTCRAGYQNLRNTDLPAETAARLTEEGKKIFPGLTEAAARAKLEADLPVLTAEFHGSSQSASQVFQQRSLVNAFLEARANLGGADGDTFAMLRAEEQARNTYSSIAQQAMTWVPLLNIVLTVVFYAMFPVIFPLFLLPQTGVPALKGYFTGFFYLAAWGPLYAVLHMFIMHRMAESMNAVAPGGITMAGMAGIDAVNADTATIAGFLMMSIPFLAAGMARGAMAVSSQATSMLAPAQAAAEAAAVERTTGNYSYGNESFQNLTGNMVQRNQWSTVPGYNAGFGRTSFTHPDGTVTSFTAGGSMIEDSRPGMSNLAYGLTRSSGFATEARKALSEGFGQVEQARQTAVEGWRATASTATDLFNSAEQRASSSFETGSGLNNSVAKMHDVSSSLSKDLQSRFGLTERDADNIARTSVMAGSANAMAGVPGIAGVRGELVARAHRETGRSISAEEAYQELANYVQREVNSDQARSAREDFMRQTSSSSDSEVRGLSQKFGSSLEESRAVTNEAIRQEENFRRVSRDFSEAESQGFRLDHNDTQAFVAFAQNELAKPENADLATSGWRPGVVVPGTPAQEDVRDIMLDRFAAQQIREMREDLGVAVPDAPERSMQGPSITTPDGVRSWSEANSSSLLGRAPDVDVRASSRDIETADLVNARLEDSGERIHREGAGVAGDVAGARRTAAALGDEVDRRHDESLIMSMPGAGWVADAFDGSESGGGGSSGVSSLQAGERPNLPVGGRITSDMGGRINPVTGKAGEHRGIDIAAPAGTPIRAPASGTVEKVAYQEGGAGHYLELRHDDGSKSRYFHMQSRPNLDEGARINEGDTIGRVGSTGRSTAPHLHYELWKDGRPVDPEQFTLKDRK